MFGFFGLSYVDVIPVKFKISPDLAFLYIPLTSRFSQIYNGQLQKISIISECPIIS